MVGISRAFISKSPRCGLIVLGAVLALACGSAEETSLDAGDGLDAGEDCGRLGRAVPLRQVTHPGRGIELDVRLESVCGGVLPRALGAAIVAEADGAVQVAPRDLASGYTLLLVIPPATPAERTALGRALGAFLGDRPAEERIALYRWGIGITQVADFGRNRERLRQLADETLGIPDAAPMLAADALAEARLVVESVGGVADLAARAVVVVAAATLAAPVAAAPSVIVWLDPDAEPEAAAHVASAELTGVMAAGAVGIGVCASREVRVSAPGATAQTFPLIPWLEEERGATCDAAAIARGERTYPRRIEFSFTPEERAAYQERLAENNRADFTLSVKLGAADAVPAKAHLRGNGSFRCERRSYTVNLAGNAPRHLLPGAATDEFMLRSMCWDQAYVETYTFNQLLASEELFPLRYGYTEVVVAGVSQGVYELLERPEDGLPRAQARARALIRRRHDQVGVPANVEWSAPGADDALSDYEALVALTNTLSGDPLVDELRRRLDLAQYLRFVAVNSVLHNADYEDEVFFLASERPETPRSYFTVMSWDPEDMLRLDCAWNQFERVDPWGLMFCANAFLEYAVMDHAALYTRFVAELEGMLDRMTEAEFSAATEATAAALLPFFSDPAVRQASLELDRPATYDAAEAAIRMRLRIMNRRFAARRAELFDLLAAYHAAH